MAETLAMRAEETSIARQSACTTGLNVQGGLWLQPNISNQVYIKTLLALNNEFLPCPAKLYFHSNYLCFLQ